MKLLDQVRDTIREKHYLIRTEQADFEGTPSFKPVMLSVIMPNVMVQSKTTEPAKGLLLYFPAFIQFFQFSYPLQDRRV